MLGILKNKGFSCLVFVVCGCPLAYAAKSPNECHAILGAEFTVAQFQECLESPSSVENSPDRSMEQEIVKQRPGFIMGVVLGEDTPRAIRDRNVDLLPDLCEETGVETKGDACAGDKYFSRDNLSLFYKGKTISINADVAAKVDLKKYIHKPYAEQGMEMYFYKDFLVYLVPIDRNGKGSLPRDIDLKSLRASLERKYKSPATWRARDGNTTYSGVSWAMGGGNSVDFIRLYSEYPSASMVIREQAIIGMLPRSVETIEAYYNLERIRLDNRFPRSEYYESRIQYYSTKGMSRLIGEIEKVQREMRAAGVASEKRKSEEKVQRY